MRVPLCMWKHVSVATLDDFPREFTYLLFERGPVLFWPEARRFQVDHVAWEPRGPSMGVTSMLSHLAFSCVLRITLKPQQALLSGLSLQPFSFPFCNGRNGTQGFTRTGQALYP